MGNTNASKSRHGGSVRHHNKNARQSIKHGKVHERARRLAEQIGVPFQYGR